MDYNCPIVSSFLCFDVIEIPVKKDKNNHKKIIQSRFNTWCLRWCSLLLISQCCVAEKSLLMDQSNITLGIKTEHEKTIENYWFTIATSCSGSTSGGAFVDFNNQPRDSSCWTQIHLCCPSHLLSPLTSSHIYSFAEPKCLLLWHHVWIDSVHL